jgi:hypothetical protein
VLIIPPALARYTDKMPPHIPVIRENDRGKLCPARVVQGTSLQALRDDSEARYVFLLSTPYSRQDSDGNARPFSNRLLITPYRLYYRPPGKRTDKLLVSGNVWSRFPGFSPRDPIPEHLEALGDRLSADVCQALSPKLFQEPKKRLPVPKVLAGTHDTVAYHSHRKDGPQSVEFTANTSNRLPVRVVIRELELVNSVTGKRAFTATPEAGGAVLLPEAKRPFTIRVSSSRCPQENLWVRIKNAYLVAGD